MVLDISTNIPIDIWQKYYLTKKESITYAPQTSITKTYAPQTALSYSYAPQLILSSPHAIQTSKKESVVSPEVSILPTQSVIPIQSDYSTDQYQKEQTLGSGGGILSNITDLVVIGIIGIVVYYFIFKKKRK